MGYKRGLLDFAAPSIASPSNNVVTYYTFMDISNGKNIQHATFTVTVNSAEGKK
jgi:hypothetical protein